MKKWISALLLFAFTVCPCMAETAEAYDADADDLLNGVVARAQNIHNDQIGYPVNEDVRLDGLCEKPTQENGQKPTMQRHGKQTRKKTS